MKLSTEQVSTSPKAEGSAKKALGSFGAVDAPKSVGVVSVKGGQEKYKGQKSDMNLPQHGGEGGGKAGKVQSGSDDSLLLKKVTPAYNGPGRFLGKE